jgi:adenine-specific DNA-methyltransferase
VIKYLGSKRLLLPLIVDVVRSLGESRTVVDLFSGTSRVGHALKSNGYRVLANDLGAYAATLARCYVQADREEVIEQVERLLPEMAAVRGKAGYITETFCVQARFFQPKNGARIDAMRDWIAKRALTPEVEAVLLVSLMEAADRVDSTTGLQMAYLKSWAPRAHNDLELRLPDVISRVVAGKCLAFQMEAQEAASTLSGDIGYLDPPYNQHSYLGNYHIWETLIRWDSPEPYGIAQKRVDTRDRQSDFNSKRKIHDALRAVVLKLDVNELVVSFNDEGYVSREEMIDLLSCRGEVIVLEKDYKRYVGAQIGVYSPGGVKVGKVSHLRNKELLFVVLSPSRRDGNVNRLLRAVEDRHGAAASVAS